MKESLFAFVRDSLLRAPWVYRTTQAVLATPIVRRFNQILASKGVTQDVSLNVLDVGCGPGDYSAWYLGRYTGLDLSKEYIHEASQKMPDRTFVVADATTFELTPSSFDVAVSIGLYHHLSDDMTVRSIERVLSHLKEGCDFHVFDAVLPRRFWVNPAGFVLRKMDRGRFVRTREQYRQLLERLGPSVIHTEFGRGGLLDFIYYVVRRTKQHASPGH